MQAARGGAGSHNVEEVRGVDGTPPMLVARHLTRRATLGAGAALAATLAAGLGRAAAQDASPAAGEKGGGSLFVQSFSGGVLMPTQGDGANMPPYTLYLWDATVRDIFFVGPSGAGEIPPQPVFAAITAETAPLAALFSAAGQGANPAADCSRWALRLVLGQDGSDPGAATYQGDLLPDDEAQTFLSVAPSAADGAIDLGPGTLVIAGLPSLDPVAAGGLRLAWG